MESPTEMALALESWLTTVLKTIPAKIVEDAAKAKQKELDGNLSALVVLSYGCA